LNITLPKHASGDDSFSVVLGRRIREVREAKRLSQREFGALGGVLKLAQMNYEKGVRVPSAEYLYSLSVHGIDTHYLLTGKRSGDTEAHHPGIDGRMLAASVDTVWRFSKDAIPALSSEDFARCVSLLYSTFSLVGREVTRETADELGVLLVTTFIAGLDRKPDGRK